jgi:hypothetical protein
MSRPATSTGWTAQRSEMPLAVFGAVIPKPLEYLPVTEAVTLEPAARN